MPNRNKQRERQRENRKKKFNEERLNGKTVFGISDPVPMLAVENIRRKDQQEWKNSPSIKQ